MLKESCVCHLIIVMRASQYRQSRVSVSCVCTFKVPCQPGGACQAAHGLNCTLHFMHIKLHCETLPGCTLSSRAIAPGVTETIPAGISSSYIAFK